MTGCTAASGAVGGYLTTGQVARKIGVTPQTVRRRIDAGQIPAQRTMGGEGHFRVPKAWLLNRHQGVIRRKPK